MKERPLLRPLVRAFLVALLLSTIAQAQSFQGGVRGTVKDAQGIIPGVTVTLTNPSNGTSRETVTNESGEYAFPAVDPSTYTIKVDVPGFAPYSNPNVRVGTQSFITLDVALNVGSLEENITVTGAAPLLEVTNASQGGTIDVKDMQEIPSEGRSVFLMATLQPTVVASGNARWNRMQDQTGNSALSMGGGAVRSNNFLIDGFPTTDLQNRSSVNPSMEALADSRVQIHTYDAEMGRTGGGVMNMTARSGANRFAGSAYTVVRPKSLQTQFLIPRVLKQPFLQEGWTNGGGAVGGPILKNRTFFWLAGEAYTNDQPQASAFSVPSMQTRVGDFSGLLRNGQPFYIKDPLSSLPCSSTTGGAGCFAGNIIPSNRLDPTGLAIAGYMPQPDVNVDNGSQNFSRTVILPNTAYQGTLKLNHRVSANNQVSAFYLRQVTNENSANYNPVYKFVGSQYLLKRSNHTLVLNDTWVLSPSTVLSVRGGWNQFLDNNELPEPFDAASLWKNNPAFTAQFSDANRFPTTSLTGYRGTGWTNRANNTYYQYGGNGSLSKLAGTHSLKIGAEYRILGLKSFSYGASTGSYTFDGRFTGNALADMLLGYPGSGNIPVSSTMDGYIRYGAAFVQDDWRISDRLTLNYGLRLEHETNLQEKNNQITTDFARDTLSPLNSLVNVVDPTTGVRRNIYGGLVFAGQNGAPTQQGGTRPMQVSPRIGLVYTVAEGLVLRGGWGTYVAPWNYPAAGTAGWGQYGYAATTTLQQSSSGTPITTLANPFPGGVLQPTGNSLGMLTNVGQATNVFLPNKGTPKAQQYSVDLQKELRGGIMVGAGYTGLTGSDLSYQTTININQLDPKYQTAGINTLQSVPNPFFGVAAAGGFASRSTIELGQLLRPYPQFGDLLWTGATGARSQYHALILQGRKRTDKYWGLNVNYTFSRLNDNQVGASNYYSASPGVQDNYVLIPWSDRYNPDAEYSRSLLDSPHKMTIAPTLNLPFGDGKKWLSGSRVGNALLGGWSVTAVSQLQSGFPVGVNQNVNGTQFLFGGAIRPNLVPGVPILADGNITDRIEANPSNNQYFNLAAFQAVAANAFGNAPRTLPGVLSPRRTSFSMSASKQVDLPGSASLALRLELLNPLNIVQWQAPASVAVGNPSFGQLRDQANTMRSVQFTLRASF